MKKMLLITLLLMLAIWSCKTVKVDTDIGREKITKAEKNKTDSVSVVASKFVQNEQKSVLSEVSDFKLSSVLDSVGRPRELEYIHEKDGKIIERIAVRGGKLIITSTNENTAENIAINKDKNEQASIQTDIDRRLDSEVKIVQKKKEKKIKGFQSGTYIIAGIAIIGIACLAFIAWRLKLFR